jgi:hypothetical protein
MLPVPVKDMGVFLQLSAEIISMETADHLLALEETENLWEAQVRGLHLWPLIRWKVYRTARYRLRGYRQGAAGEDRLRRYFALPKWPFYLKTLSAVGAGRFSGRKTLFLTARNTRIPLDRSGRSFDRVHDAYFDLSEAPLILEANRFSRASHPDHRFEDCRYSLDVFWLWSYARSRFITLSERERGQISDFTHSVASLYGYPDMAPGLFEMALRLIRQHEVFRSFFRRSVLSKLAGNLAIVTYASYMGEYALLTKTLHECGFEVVEPQHGIIHRIHDAYRLPSALSEDDTHPARDYLPDTILTYGDYWNRQIQSPSTVKTIGYSYLQETVERSRTKVTVKGDQILILSQPFITSDLVDLTVYLAHSFPQRPIIFKLHPIEELSDPIFQPLGDLPNVHVESDADVYPLIAESAVIVGYSTTVLVEAVAFPGKRIFFQDRDDVIPAEVGSHFETPEELAAMLDDPATGVPDCAPREFWEIDWEARLRAFFAERRSP